MFHGKSKRSYRWKTKIVIETFPSRLCHYVKLVQLSYQTELQKEISFNDSQNRTYEWEIHTNISLENVRDPRAKFSSQISLRTRCEKLFLEQLQESVAGLVCVQTTITSVPPDEVSWNLQELYAPSETLWTRMLSSRSRRDLILSCMECHMM